VIDALLHGSRASLSLKLQHKMTPTELSDRQTLLELLKANYEILTGIVRRLAAWEKAGASNVSRRPESSSTAADLAEDAIPYLRQRLGLEPDLNLKVLSRLLRQI
jgi:hypothetical protein